MSEERQYYKMKWYQKIWYKMIDKIKEKFQNFHFPWIKFGIALFIVLVLAVVIIIVVNGTKQFPFHEPYDKTGFVNYDELTTENGKIVKGDYELVIDYKTTHFTLTNTATNDVWTSAPEGSNKLDTFVLYYSKGLGQPTPMGSYSNSIDHEGKKQYSVRADNTSIEILYNMGGKVKIDYSDFPELISEERYNDIIRVLEEASESSLIRIFNANYQVNNEYHYYKLINPEQISQTYIKKLYEIFYEIYGYTREDLEEDNKEFGITTTKKYPTFEVAIKYSLDENGLVVEIINDSLLDYEDFPLIYIDLLPYFGCATTEEDGYAIIPDGSGILLDFNSPRSYASYYEQRIYGSDEAVNSLKMKENKQKITLPVYGMKVEKNGLDSQGFINTIEVGAEACSLVANIVTAINTDLERYNQVYYRYYYREYDIYKFSSLAGLSDIKTWTNSYQKSDLKIHIMSVDGEGTYTQMAQKYQQYLVSKGFLVKKDLTTEPVLDLTLLGGYYEKTNFIGIPYSRKRSLTSPNQVLEISKILREKQINQINIIYDGWYNEGIKPSTSENISLSSAIASKSDLKSLQVSLDAIGVNFYPTIYFNTAYSDKNLNNKERVKNMYGQDSIMYDNEESSYGVDKTSRERYLLQASMFDKNFNKINKKYQKLTFKNIGINDAFTIMYGSYQSSGTSFRNDTKNSICDIMNKYSQNFESIMGKNPYDFALKYLSLITDLPFEGTNYQITQCSVPFYQLVISGYIDYSSPAFNTNDHYELEYHKMKALEYGSNLSMIWTYQETTDLIGTEYDYYYSTYYLNWLDKTVEIYKELQTSKVYQTSLVKHEILDLTGTINKSTYQNGMEIIFNYTNKEYVYNSLDGSIVIPANSYKVVKEVN